MTAPRTTPELVSSRSHRLYDDLAKASIEQREKEHRAVDRIECPHNCAPCRHGCTSNAQCQSEIETYAAEQRADAQYRERRDAEDRYDDERRPSTREAWRW